MTRRMVTKKDNSNRSKEKISLGVFVLKVLDSVSLKCIGFVANQSPVDKIMKIVSNREKMNAVSIFCVCYRCCAN